MHRRRFEAFGMRGRRAAIRWIIARGPTTINVFLPRSTESASGSRGGGGGGQIARLSKKGWEAIIYKILPGLRRSGIQCSARRTDASGDGEGGGRGL